MIQFDEIKLDLIDDQYEQTFINNDRLIVRAIVFDDEDYLYFVRAIRDDLFGQATLIETSGGGVEKGEDLITAIKRELNEELGANVEVIGKLGIVNDYYNLLHRHNINNYYLCKVINFGDKHLMDDEINTFHLSTLKLTYKQAIEEYELRSKTKIGKLIARRELPILKASKKAIEKTKTIIS